MHNGATYTARALEEVIITLQERGYTIVPVGELIYKSDYRLNHAGKQYKDE